MPDGGADSQVVTSRKRQQKTAFEMQLAQRIGENLKLIRQERDLDAKKLADFLNVSLRTYHSYEAAERRLSLAQVASLSVVLQVPLDRLVWGDRGRPLPRQSILLT